MAELATLIASHRLVTLTGVGGVGKTRLAIEVARVTAEFAIDGVVFVDLAPITSDDAVPMALARVLELREQASTPAVDLITGALRHSRVIALLDNAEHVRDGCQNWPMLCAPICPEVRVIVTSRIPSEARARSTFRCCLCPCRTNWQLRKIYVHPTPSAFWCSAWWLHGRAAYLTTAQSWKRREFAVTSMVCRWPSSLQLPRQGNDSARDRGPSG